MASLPPFEPLHEVGRRLERAKLEWALGGSGLLHALGLADVVRDWDVTTDASVEATAKALADLTPVLHGNSGIHADHKLVCFDGVVEVIVKFAFFADECQPDPDRVLRMPCRTSRSWRGVPLASPEVWAVAYALMAHEKPGRAEKSAALFRWVREHGGDPAVIAALTAALEGAPLPPALAGEVAGLEAMGPRAPRATSGGRTTTDRRA